MNEEEAYALTHLPPKQCASFLKNFCLLVVIKVREKGCWVCADSEPFHSPGIPTAAVDKTGAGDLFASAFLYGYLKGYSPKDCAYFGNLAGSAGVEKFGAELPLSKWGEIRRLIDTKQN